MFNSRRHLLQASFAAAAALLVRSGNVAAQNPSQRNRPTSPNGTDEDSSNPPAATGNKALLEQRQKDIKKEIEKLFDLASQLKAEVEKTDATTVLSLGIVRKAEEIERLAKQIKDNAKG